MHPSFCLKQVLGEKVPVENYVQEFYKETLEIIEHPHFEQKRKESEERCLKAKEKIDKEIEQHEKKDTMLSCLF